MWFCCFLAFFFNKCIQMGHIVMIQLQVPSNGNLSNLSKWLKCNNMQNYNWIVRDHIHHISIRLTLLPRPSVDKSMEFLARNQKWRKPAAGQNGELTVFPMYFGMILSRNWISVVNFNEFFFLIRQFCPRLRLAERLWIGEKAEKWKDFFYCRASCPVLCVWEEKVCLWHVPGGSCRSKGESIQTSFLLNFPGEFITLMITILQQHCNDNNIVMRNICLVLTHRQVKQN